MSPTVCTRKKYKQKEIIWQQYRLCCAVAEHQILGGKHFLVSETGSGKIWWLKKYNKCLQKKRHCQWTLLRGKKPKWIFQNFGDLLQLLEFVPASRERVVPTEWQVRTVLGYWKSKTNLVSIRAPQYRNLCWLVTSWISPIWTYEKKQQWPRVGSSFRTPALATMTGLTVRCFTNNLTADVQYALNKYEPLGSRQKLFFYWKCICTCNGIFSARGSLSTSFLNEYALPMLYGSRLSEATLTSWQTAVESTAWVLLWKTRSGPIGVRVCPVAQFNSSVLHLTRASGQWLCSGKKIPDLSRSQLHLRTKEKTIPIIHLRWIILIS